MLPIPYVRQLLGTLLSRRRRKIIQSAYLMPSEHLGRDVMVDVYRPAVPPWRLLSLAVFNDGQDLPRMDFLAKLEAAHKENSLGGPIMCIGLHAGDRLREYGTASRKDYEGRGDLSEGSPRAARGLGRFCRALRR